MLKNHKTVSTHSVEYSKSVSSSDPQNNSETLVVNGEKVEPSKIAETLAQLQGDSMGDVGAMAPSGQNNGIGNLGDGVNGQNNGVGNSDSGNMTSWFRNDFDSNFNFKWFDDTKTVSENKTNNDLDYSRSVEYSKFTSSSNPENNSETLFVNGEKVDPSEINETLPQVDNDKMGLDFGEVDSGNIFDDQGGFILNMDFNFDDFSF